MLATCSPSQSDPRALSAVDVRSDLIERIQQARPGCCISTWQPNDFCPNYGCEIRHIESGASVLLTVREWARNSQIWPFEVAVYDYFDDRRSGRRRSKVVRFRRWPLDYARILATIEQFLVAEINALTRTQAFSAFMASHRPLIDDLAATFGPENVSTTITGGPTLILRITISTTDVETCRQLWAWLTEEERSQVVFSASSRLMLTPDRAREALATFGRV